MKKYYTYIHRRADTNEIFYVGIGRHNDHNSNYQRARSPENRNIIWRRIKDRHGFIVEIIFEADNSYEVKQKEIELIAIYGRLDLKTGILANMTGGGDGRMNGTFESYEKNRKNLSKYRELKKKKCYQYDLNGNFIKEWGSLTDASNYLGDESNSGILVCCKGRCKYYKGFIWNYSLINIKLNIKRARYSEIFQYDLGGNFIQRWDNYKLASKTLNIELGNIRRCANNPENFPIAGNFQWRYVKEEKIDKFIKKTKTVYKVLKLHPETLEILEEYSSQIDAGNAVGVTFKAISKAINKKTKSKGFYWKHKN